jgi:hypothetical protein
MDGSVMTFTRVFVPILIVGLIALLLLAMVLFWHKNRKVVEEETRLAEWIDSVEMCGKKNPRTGWVCERDENHYGKHWQTIHGEKYDWLDE